MRHGKCWIFKAWTWTPSIDARNGDCAPNKGCTLNSSVSSVLRSMLLVVPMLIIPFGKPATGFEPPTDHDRDQAELVLRGVVAERAEIHSGVVAIRGTRMQSSADKPELNGPVQGVFAFDLDKEWFRYDNVESQRIRLLNSSNVPGGKLTRQAIENVDPDVHRRYLSYILNDDYMLYWTRDGDSVYDNIELLDRTAEPSQIPMEHHHYCDIRAAGLMKFDQFQEFVSPQAVVNELLQKSLADVQSSDGKLEIRYADDQAESVIVIETEDGYRPISRVTRILTAPFEYRMKASWERRDAVDVPVRLVMIKKSSEFGFELKYDLQFEWQSLNEPIDPKWFDYHDLKNVPSGGTVLVLDRRGDEIERVGVWKGNGHVEPLPTQSSGRDIDKTPLARESRPWMMILITVNCVAAVMLVVFWLWRRRRSHG